MCFWHAYSFSGESRVFFPHGLTVKLENAVEKGKRVLHTQICILGPLLARVHPQQSADLPGGDTGTAAATPRRSPPPTRVSLATGAGPATPGPRPLPRARRSPPPTAARPRRCKMDTATTPSAPRRLAPAHCPGRPTSGKCSWGG